MRAVHLYRCSGLNEIKVVPKKLLIKKLQL